MRMIPTNKTFKMGNGVDSTEIDHRSTLVGLHSNSMKHEKKNTLPHNRGLGGQKIYRVGILFELHKNHERENALQFITLLKKEKKNFRRTNKGYIVK